MGSFLKILISVIIGFISNIIYQKTLEHRRICDLKTFIIYWSEQIKDPIDKQLQSFDEFIRKLIMSENIDGITLNSYAINTEEILNLNESDKVKTFVLSTKKSNINKNRTYFLFNSSLKGLKLAKENFEEYHGKLISIMSDLQREWNNNLRNLHEIKHEVTAPYASNLSTNEFARNVNQMFNDWLKIVNKTPKVTFETLIDPLDQYCQKLYTQNPQNKDVHKVVSQVQDLKVVYNKFSQNKREMVYNFLLIRRNYKNSKKKFINNLFALKALETKNQFSISPTR